MTNDDRYVRFPHDGRVHKRTGDGTTKCGEALPDGATTADQFDQQLFEECGGCFTDWQSDQT